MPGAQSPRSKERHDHRCRRQQCPGVSTQIANGDVLLVQRRPSYTQSRQSKVTVTASRKRRSLNTHAPNIRTDGDETLPPVAPRHRNPANTGPRAENLARKRSLLLHQLGPLAACRKAENCGAQRLASSVTVCHHRPLGVARFHSRLCPLHQNSEAQSVKLSGRVAGKVFDCQSCGAAQSWVPRKKAGAAGTAVAAVGGRHFGAAVLRCYGPVKAGCWSVLVPFPFSFSSRLRGFLD